MAGEKTVPAANSGDLAAMLQNLLGVGTGQKSTTTQNTGALQDVLSQLNAIDPSAQLATLFQQAQARIPQIAAAKASSGSRSPGGTLDPQIQKLLSQITLAAQQQMSQQQLQKAEIATRAAQGVAQGSTQTVQQPQANNLQKLMQAITVAQGAGKMFGVDLGQEAGKKLRSALGITSTGLGEVPSPIGLSTGLDFGSGNGLDLGPLTGTSGVDLSIPSPSMSFGSDWSGFSSMPDFSSSFSFGDVSSAPSLNFGDVSFGSGGGGFGGFDFGSFPSGTEGAGASFSLDPSSSPSIMPLFSAANYLVNPEKIGDAFELGQGNVLGDISQLAGLGSTIGGVGSLLGAGLGGLSALAGPLGLVAMVGGVLADAFSNGPSYEDYGKQDLYQYLKGDQAGASDLEKAVFVGGRLDNMPELSKYRQLFSAPVLTLADQYKAAGITSGTPGSRDAGLYKMWDSLTSDADRAYARQTDEGIARFYGNGDGGMTDAEAEAIAAMKATYGGLSWQTPSFDFGF
jgi:hypothetical protein